MRRIFFLFLLLTRTALSAQSERPPSEELPQYSCFTDHISLEKWMEQGERVRDVQGILVQKKEYHPLSIALYGIMSYELYLETGEKKYRQQVYDQYKYFCDTSKVDLLDSGRAMGLPYNFIFHDMKPPWYSGMTQGAAISFLLRYYKLSGDKEALKKSEQLARLMLKPVENGGTIGRTHNKLMWIEEYPGSRYSPQVLNGFINGLIGLYEYRLFFPQDTAAKRIHDSCYAVMIRQFPAYDTENWTSYNLRRFPISNGYLRYQLQELQHLYEIYGDERLRRQMMIWAMFAYKKSDEVNKYYFKQDYQFGVTMEMGADSVWRLPPMKIDNAMKEVRPVKKRVPFRLRKLTELELKDSLHFVSLRFDTLLPGNTLKVAAQNSGGAMIVEWPGHQGNVVKVGTPHAKFNRLSVWMPEPGKPRLLNIYTMPDPGSYELPMFAQCIYNKKVTLKKGETYRVKLRSDNVAGPVIFYRRAYPPAQATLAKWMHKQSVFNGETFTAPENGTFEFFISFPLLIPDAKIYGLEIKAVE